MKQAQNHVQSRPLILKALKIPVSFINGLEKESLSYIFLTNRVENDGKNKTAHIF
jgi:hypothetical protein